MTFELTKGKDRMTVEVLDDGSIKTTTAGTVSPPNHGSAEFLYRQWLRALTGFPPGGCGCACGCACGLP